MRILHQVMLSLILISSVGCDAAKDLKGMLAKQQAISAAIEEEIGTEAQVGWNYQNGKFTNFSVILPGDKVGRYSVAELSNRITPIVLESFDSAPGQIMISVSFDPSAHPISAAP